MCSSTKKTRNGISENNCYDAVNEKEPIWFGLHIYFNN